MKKAAVPPTPDDGSASFTGGYVWAVKIMGLGFELVLPLLAGYWLDRQWQTEPWCLLAGALVGIAAFSISIVSLSSEISRKSPGSHRPQ